MLKIINTLSGQKEEFIPLKDKKVHPHTHARGFKKWILSHLPSMSVGVNMFVCGPTVYDYIHIGNARTFVFFDVVAKYLKYKGYDVNYIQNITDIDNKIIERAKKENADPLEYAKKYTEIFKQDMLALGVTSPEYKNATNHIPEVIKQVQTLLDKGNAYVIENDGIYFDLSTFPDYGKLSGRTAGMADDAVSRIDDSDKKRNRGDFAIWKFSQAGDPSWQAPFGDGRPGWHIEDTAITEKYFGPQYDIHGGGEDLKFPHHEAEIAQQESASGKKPFVKFWMHVGFLVNKEEKMSKSAGNFMTLRETLKKWPKEVLRFYLLSGHYRSPLQFSEETLKQSQGGVQRIREFLARLEKVKDSQQHDAVTSMLHSTKSHYNYYLDEDFNTQGAIGELFSLLKKIYPRLDTQTIGQENAKNIIDFLTEVNQTMGIIPSEYKEPPKDILDLINQRQKLRADKKWGEADKIRAQIEEMGYRVEDTIYGPLVSKLD